MIEPPKSKLNTAIKVLVSVGICAGLFYASTNHQPKRKPINNIDTKTDPSLLNSATAPKQESLKSAVPQTIQKSVSPIAQSSTATGTTKPSTPTTNFIINNIPQTTSKSVPTPTNGAIANKPVAPVQEYSKSVITKPATVVLKPTASTQKTISTTTVVSATNLTTSNVLTSKSVAITKSATPIITKQPTNTILLPTKPAPQTAMHAVQKTANSKQQELNKSIATIAPINKSAANITIPNKVSSAKIKPATLTYKKKVVKHHRVTRKNKPIEQQIYYTESLKLTHVDFKPLLQVAGYTGDATLGKTQIIMPILANTDRVFYGAVNGKISSKSADGWSAGGGFGYRRVINDRIYGAYLLANYNTTPSHNKFFVINPGLESLGINWDFRFNAYIPTNTNRYLTAADWAGDAYGDYSYTSFGSDGHSIYDHKLRTYEATGTGADAEVGRVIPRTKLKVYLGGYYFKPRDLGSITGASARITYDINSHTAIEVRNTYDNLTHNTATIGVKLTFGGIKEADKTSLGIASRLLDPIENNLATAGKGHSSPIRSKNLDQGNYLHQDKVWFFTPPTTTTSKNGIVSGSGTYTDPYQGMNQDTLDHIAKDPNGTGYANLYFKPGTYNLSNEFIANRLILAGPEFNNYSLYGRSLDYKSPPTAAMRPEFDEFDGAMDFHDNTGITLNYLHIRKSDEHGEDAIGMILTNTSVTLNNTEVETMRQPGVTGNVAAIAMFGSSTLNLANNNYISANKVYSEDSRRLCAGVYLEEGSTLNIGNNNTISAFNATNGWSGIAGVDATNSNVTIYGSNNNILAHMVGISDLATSSAYSGAIRITGTSNLTINAGAENNTLEGYYESDLQTNSFSTMSGIFQSGLSNVTINGNNNQIRGKVTPYFAQAYGIFDAGVSALTTQANKITINGIGNIVSATALNTPRSSTDGIFATDTDLIIKPGNEIVVDVNKITYGQPTWWSDASGIQLRRANADINNIKMDIEGVTINVGRNYTTDISEGILFTNTSSANSIIKNCNIFVNSNGGSYAGIKLDKTYGNASEIAKFNSSGNYFIIRPDPTRTVA